MGLKVRLACDLPGRYTMGFVQSVLPEAIWDIPIMITWITPYTSISISHRPVKTLAEKLLGGHGNKPEHACALERRTSMSA